MTDYLQGHQSDWSTSTRCLNELINRYAFAYYLCDKAQYWSELALTEYYVGSKDFALLYCLFSNKHVYETIQNLIYFKPTYDPPYILPYYLKNYGGAEVTWQSICEAWVKDDFEGRFWTIGIIDRMRQIMWDEPFDLTWAARPEQEEIPSE